MTTLTDMRAVNAAPPAANRRTRTAAAARAFLVAALSALAAAATYAVFVRTSGGQRLDERAMANLDDLADTGSRLSTLLQGVTVGSTAVVLGVCVVIAVLRRRWALAAAAALLVVGANLTTQVLKDEVLTRPLLGYGHSGNSLPSGHTTVVASLVLAALIVVPRGGRWLVGLGGSIGVAVTGVGTLLASWHRPSDVLAALAVALGWGALALGVISLFGVDLSAARPTARATALVVGLAVAGGLFVALGVRPDGTAEDMLLHVATMSGLAVAGALVVGLFARMVDARVG